MQFSNMQIYYYIWMYNLHFTDNNSIYTCSENLVLDRI